MLLERLSRLVIKKFLEHFYTLPWKESNQKSARLSHPLLGNFLGTYFPEVG